MTRFVVANVGQYLNELYKNYLSIHVITLLTKWGDFISKGENAFDIFILSNPYQIPKLHNIQFLLQLVYNLQMGDPGQCCGGVSLVLGLEDRLDNFYDIDNNTYPYISKKSFMTAGVQA
ncbi:hypothetical protein ACJX0J_017739, partial [Zea mays]